MKHFILALAVVAVLFITDPYAMQIKQSAIGGVSVSGGSASLDGNNNFTGSNTFSTMTVVDLLLVPSGFALIPSGMIIMTSGACPAGFAEYTDARGRHIVGVPAGGTVAGTLGTALTDLQENSHNHEFTLNANDGARGNVAGEYVEPATLQLTDINDNDNGDHIEAPYIQLRMCLVP